MRGFLLIVIAGLGSAALGTGLGWLVGILSPEFIGLVAQPNAVADPARLGAALGLVSGLLLGVAAMAFGLLVDAIRAWATRGKSGSEVPPSQASQLTGKATRAPTDFSAKPV
jgi:hypothetical protein